MSHNTKIVLGVVLALCVVCLGGFIIMFVGFTAMNNRVVHAVNQAQVQVQQVTGEAVQVQTNGSAPVSDFINFDLPGRFTQTSSVTIVDMHMLTYKGSDEKSHIFLLQVPATLHMDMETMIEQARQNDDNHMDRVEVVGKQNVTIDGQSVEMTISEGTNSDGEDARMWSGLFQGKNGSILVVYEAPINHWDQAELDNFLASIHE